MSSGVRFRMYLHMQSAEDKMLAVASISNYRKEIADDQRGRRAPGWIADPAVRGTRADDVRVKRTMAALEANGITALRASDAASAKRIVLNLNPNASLVHRGPRKRSTYWVSRTRSKSPVAT